MDEKMHQFIFNYIFLVLLV